MNISERNTTQSAVYQIGFLKNVRNSVLVSSVTAFSCVFFGGFAACAFSRIRMKGYKILLGLILLLAMLPGICVLGPLYQMWVKFGIMDTYLALILPYTAFSLPFSIWYLSNFFKAIPVELEEAAVVDGCTPSQAMLKVVFPIAIPGMVSIGILSFIGAWNEFLFALALTQTDAARTAVVAIILFQSIRYFPWGDIAAGAVTLSIPILVLVLFTQRWLVRSLFSGILKG